MNQAGSKPFSASLIESRRKFFRWKSPFKRIQPHGRIPIFKRQRLIQQYLRLLIVDIQKGPEILKIIGPAHIGNRILCNYKDISVARIGNYLVKEKMEIESIIIINK